VSCDRDGNGEEELVKPKREKLKNPPPWLDLPSLISQIEHLLVTSPNAGQFLGENTAAKREKERPKRGRRPKRRELSTRRRRLRGKEVDLDEQVYADGAVVEQGLFSRLARFGAWNGLTTTLP
jgi:hypothetical protein